MNNLTPIIRSTVDYLFYGLKGSGKSIAVTYYLFCDWIKGYNIFVNYKVDFDHERVWYVENIDDLRGMKNGTAVFDDCERMISSKFLDKKGKDSIIDGLLDTGKANINCWFIAKRPLEVEKSIRSICEYFIKCEMYMDCEIKNIADLIEKSQYLDFYCVQLTIYHRDNLNEPCFIEIIHNLPIWGKLYDTTYKIEHLKK